jgi:hypothetical protein
MYKLLEPSVNNDDYFSLSLEARNENDFVKTAAKRDLPEEVNRAIQNLVRKPDHAYMLVTAMGDGETWGSNKNGDYFPNEALLGEQNTPVYGVHPDKDERPKLEMKTKRRFETFEDGHFFKRHRNKYGVDPHFGYVPHAIWHPRMRTVLLIVGVDRKKAPDTAERIDRNDRVPVSMGAKLPWDRCSICHKKHYTILQYCSHLRGQMNSTLPDGSLVCAENLFPRFFDISEVMSPAFLAGYQLEKVAGVEYSIDLAEYYDIGRFDKYAETEKEASLYKEMPVHIEGAIARTCETEKELPKSLLNDLAKLKPQEAWGALTHVGIIAKPNEFAYVMLMNAERPDLAEKFLNTRGVVKHPKVKGLDTRLHNMVTIDINHAATQVSKDIPNHILEDRSLTHVDDRVYNTDRGLRKEAGVEGAIGLGSILSALYLLYRKNVENKFAAYALIGAGIGAMSQDRDISSKFVGNNPFATEDMNKRASLGMTALRAGAGFATPYVLGAHYQNKINQGQQVGVMGRLMANNPGKIGILGAFTAANPTAMYNGAKIVTKDVAGGLQNMMKK